MGVAGEDSVVLVAGNVPVLLYELQDDAREPGRHFLECYVRDPLLVERETLGEELDRLDSQLGLPTNEPVENRAGQKSDLRGRYRLSK